jgi:surfeit locus 1 family protein
VTRKGIVALIVFDLVAVLVVTGLAALSAWQMHRRDYKLDLIARVEARTRAEHVPAPSREAWADVSAAADEYRRVSAKGRWLSGHSVLTQAVTARGGGYWVMTPLAREDGTTILVNRGFIPTEDRDSASWRPSALEPVTVSGLLRMTEPGGGFLRTNDPTAGRWFSRDVAAIAASQRLRDVAPYFIDVERKPGDTGLPIGGLTVLDFPNNHLVYALTWGTLAVMAAAAAMFVNLDRWRPGWFASRHAGLHGF